jgi:hypothetical protein
MSLILPLVQRLHSRLVEMLDSVPYFRDGSLARFHIQHWARTSIVGPRLVSATVPFLPSCFGHYQFCCGRFWALKKRSGRCWLRFRACLPKSHPYYQHLTLSRLWLWYELYDLPSLPALPFLSFPPSPLSRCHVVRFRSWGCVLAVLQPSPAAYLPCASNFLQLIQKDHYHSLISLHLC